MAEEQTQPKPLSRSEREAQIKDKAGLVIVIMALFMAVLVDVLVAMVMAVVMPMLVLMLVLRVRCCPGSSGRPNRAQQQLGIDNPRCTRQQGGSRATAGRQRGRQVLQSHLADAVSPADQHQIGGLQLVLEQILDRIEMVEAGVGQALGLEGDRVGDHMAIGQRLTIHHRHNTMDAGARADGWPAKSGHQGLGQRQPTGLDDDAIELVRALQQLLHRRQKVILHGAAQAAIRQFDQTPLELIVGTEPA